MIEITIDKRHATADEVAALERQPGYATLLSDLAMHGRKAGIVLTVLEQPPEGVVLQVTQNTDNGALHAHLVGSTRKGKTN